MKPSRILVCGGRTFDSRSYVYKMLDEARYHFAPRFCIIQGGAGGADGLARDWATERGVPMLEVPAAWKTLGKSAGSIRNGWMIEWCNPDLVIAFEGGPGTRDMVRKAREAGIAVYDLR